MNKFINFDGIEYLGSLESLQIGDNIKEIKGLDNLKELTHLMIGSIKIRNVDKLYTRSNDNIC
jgi:hypothetical protein